MKIDRYHRLNTSRGVKPCFTLAALLAIVLMDAAVGTHRVARGQSESSDSPSQPAEPTTDDAPTHPQAAALLDQTIDRLANGPAFDCKVRQRVRTAGREVVGVGTYLQVGGGSGQFSFQLNMHDGDGKHTLLQISDGRLAWTRSEIAETVSLSRVDVGWLDEGARTLDRRQRIKPSQLVGGPCELLDTVRRQYDLKLGVSTLDERPLVVLIGTLKQAERDRIAAIAANDRWPQRYPTRVHIAIAKTDDPQTGFGMGLPVRIEHLSDPVEVAAPSGTADEPAAPPTRRRKLISSLEFYSIRPVTPPPVERFRFENQDAEVDFVNETSRYEDRFNIRVSAQQRARYR
jgi:hypothetical protein